MKFKFVRGKNFKNYVFIQDLCTKTDMERYEFVKDKVLTRREYQPFNKKEKYITGSYIFNEYVFPYQFWYDVQSELKKYCDIEYQLEDKPDYIITDESIFYEWYQKLRLPEDIFTDDEKYSFQPESVIKAINEEMGRIEIGTSGGKTFITYLYCKYMVDVVFKDFEEKKKILVIVPTQLLCKQLQADFAHYDSKIDTFDQLIVSTIYSGSKRIENAEIVCGTFQSLCEYDTEFFDDFSVVVCDELHRANMYSIRTKIYDKCNYAQFLFGMTGTFPEWKSLEYLHIVAMFGPELVKVTTKELIDSGVSNQVEIDIINLDYLDDNGNEITYINDYIKVKGAKSGRIYRDEDDSRTDDEILSSYKGSAKIQLQKHYLHRNMSRIDVCASLINHFNVNSILLVDTVEYCDIIRERILVKCPTKKVFVIHGKIKKRDDMLDYVKNDQTGNSVIIATFGTMSTGVSIKNLTHGYLLDWGKKDTRIRQTIGRLLRILCGKEMSRLFDLSDNLKYSVFHEHAKQRSKMYTKQQFPVKKYNKKININ